MSQTTRRNFLLTSMAVASGLVGTASCQSAPRRLAQSAPNAPEPSANPAVTTQPAIAPPPPQSIPEQVLGRTGVSVPIFGLGGAGRTPLSQIGKEAEAIAIIETAVERGIRYFDTAASYGPSEERMGKVLSPYRSQLFLATKASSRDRDGAWRELERSLQRLQTDYLDLWQFHALTYDWDLDTVLDERNGAIQVAEDAKQQGIIRHIGITGHHNPAIITAGLQRYPFDTALVPINAADKHTTNPFIQGVLPIAQQKKTGLIAMKVPAYGRLIESGAVDGMRQAMGYALSQPGVHTCIIAAETVAQLEANIEVARAFQPLPAEELVAIEQRTAEKWQDFSFFRSWT